MKRYCFYVFFCMIVLLNGCYFGDSASGDAHNPEVLYYDYSEMGYSLQFPEEWAGCIEVREENEYITVRINGILIYSLVSVPNVDGARVWDQQLEENEFIYHSQNGTHFFYYKLHNILPKEMCPATWHRKSAQWCTKEAMLDFWRIEWDTDICTALVEDDAYYLSMKTGEYVNHRLGISFTIPQNMLERGDVYLYPTNNDRVISLVLMETPSSRIYLMSTFLALPVDDPYRSEYNIIDSPELVLYDGRLYGGINEWRDSTWRQYVYVYYGWERFPDYIQNMFTFDEIQSVVNSFRLLFMLEECDNVLENKIHYLSGALSKQGQRMNAEVSEQHTPK